MTNLPRSAAPTTATTTMYTKQTAAHVLRIICALITAVREGADKPIKLKQQTIDYLAVSEVAVLRKSYADSANSRSNKATELRKLLQNAVSNRDSLRALAVELLPISAALPKVNDTYQSSFMAGRYPLIQVVIDLTKHCNPTEILVNETFSTSEFNSFRMLIVRFIAEFSKPLVEENVERRLVKDSKVAARMNDVNQREFKPSELITKAVEVLTDPTKHRWEAVSCAIALATGRRMVEVHLFGQFWAPSDDEWLTFADKWGQQIGADKLPDRSSCLAFKGQAKGKARKVEAVELKEVTWVFPTLVDPALVLKGIEHLQTKGKRLEANSPGKLVNDRYSKHLSSEVKTAWRVVDDIAECSYHKLRAAYFCTTSGRLNLSHTQFDKAAPMLIGDGDITTIQSYQRYRVTE